MPIIKTVKPNKDAILAIWKITETIENLLVQVDFNKYDQASYDVISNDEKKLEWLSSRLTIRYLVEEIGGEYLGIIKDKHNKPYLKDINYHLSISHSFPYAAAIIHKVNPVGIDIEMPRDKIRRISQRFLSDIELKAANENIDALSIYWSAKETLYKIYGKKKLIFRQNIRVNPFEMSNAGEMKGVIKMDDEVTTYTLRFIKIDNHYLVYNI